MEYSKKALKELCQSGAFNIFMQMIDEILKEQDVIYDDNPHKLAYNHGLKDGAINLKDDIEKTIEDSAI